jgi:glycerol kinase
MLPEVKDSSGLFGTTDKKWFGAEIPIAGVAGDQQAATFGQGCFQKGMAKNTYGTGSFVLLNTGTEPVASKHGLLTTIGWGIKGKVTYCLEGSIFVTGAAVQWLRDGLKLFKNSSEVEKLAHTVEDSGGVYFVPALVGMGTPHWDPYARGLIIGIDRGTTGGHLARATVESMAFQTCDVIEAMEADSGTKLKQLRVDGGAVVNDELMQFQADLLGKPVLRPKINETTALGAAYLAGLAVGYWKGPSDVTNNWQLDKEFQPAMKPAERQKRRRDWSRAVERAKGWIEPS